MQDDSAPPAAPAPRVCFACGSAAVAIGKLLDEGEGSSGAALVATERDPDAFVMTGAYTAPLLARICGACGHVELFVSVEQARALYANWYESLRPK